MNETHLRAWITGRYGPITETFAGCVFVAVVPLLKGVAIGCGSSRACALYDLYCDLYLPASRESLVGAVRQQWEIDRRDRLDCGGAA